MTTIIGFLAGVLGGLLPNSSSVTLFHENLNKFGFSDAEILQMDLSTLKQFIGVQPISLPSGGLTPGKIDGDPNETSNSVQVDQRLLTTKVTACKYSDGEYGFFVKNSVTWFETPSEREQDVLSVQYTNNLSPRSTEGQPDTYASFSYHEHFYSYAAARTIAPEITKETDITRKAGEEGVDSSLNLVNQTFSSSFSLPADSHYSDNHYGRVQVDYEYSNFTMTSTIFLENNSTDFLKGNIMSVYGHQTSSWAFNIEDFDFSFTIYPPSISITIGSVSKTSEFQNPSMLYMELKYKEEA